MPYYVLTNAPDIQNPTWTSSGADLPLYGVYGNWGLPVFTSEETLRDFAAIRYGGQEGVIAGVNRMSPFELADMVEVLEADGLKYLLFDPTAVPGGGLRIRRKPASVSDYLRFIEEIRPGTERLAAEASKKFGTRLPNPRDEKFMRWWVPRAKEIAANARARIGEWEIEDGSWSREEPDPPAH